MKNFLLIFLMLAIATAMTSCTGGGGTYSGTYVDDVDDGYYWDDEDDWGDYDDGWDDDYDDGWDDSDDSWDDDWDDDWDNDDDGCWDCGDDWGWYDDAQRENESHSTDIMGDVAVKEDFRLQRASEFYANKFNLSDEQSLKIAKTMQDYRALNERTAKDLAEFSQKLYGLNPEEIVSGVASAQVGDHSKLDSVIEKAAKNFNTTTQNMRDIVKTLHGNALKENGIDL